MNRAFDYLPAESFYMTVGHTSFYRGPHRYNVRWKQVGLKPRLCKGVQGLRFIPEFKVTVTSTAIEDIEFIVNDFLGPEKAKDVVLQHLDKV